MAFDELVQVRTTKKNTKLGERGCVACSLNKVKGVHKIMGEIDGHDILIVAQSPGPEENEDQRPLVGKSGQFLWTELKAVGIRRTDCDITQAVRCFPATLTEGSYNSFLKMRNPTALEVHCCSVHTETELVAVQAKHILVLGQVAQKAFLQTRSVPTQKIFWSEKHQAKIYLADHPAFFIGGYGAGARLQSFRSTLHQLAADWKNEEVPTSDDFVYLREQDYRLVLTGTQASKAGMLIYKYAKTGRRISVDIEYDIIDGEMVIFAVGFSPKPGLSFIFVCDNPYIEQSVADADCIRNWIRVLLENRSVRKVMHYGCSDALAFEKLNVFVKGFEWDTYFADYLGSPDAKKYGLEALAERRYQEFSGYKTIVVSDLMEALPEGTKVPSAVLNGALSAKLKWLKDKGHYHLSRLKPETLRLYNGADADLTKRIEIDTKKNIPQALIQLYIDLSFVLTAMESNGPWFDPWQHAQVDRLYPYLEQKALVKLRDMIDDREFNPGSPQQVYDVVYNRLGLVYPMHKGKPNTQKKTMLMLSREHPFPGAVVDWRKLSKAKSTYIDGQLECALKFGGRLKTKWNATGTSTGRLSSSGGDDGGINLQNLHGDPRLQNMCVSDKRWRQVFNAITKILKTSKKEYWEQRIEAWIRKYMPDLKTFLILDYGQIEIRVLALLSGDKNLIKDCASADIHTTVGVTMTGWDPEKIRHDKKTRTLTKNIHFGIVFLIAKHNLYQFIKAMDPTFDGTEEMISDAYDRYFARYKGVKRYMDKQQEFAQEHGYVETLFGLHRTLNVEERHATFDDDFGDDEASVIAEAVGGKQVSWRSQSVNTPVQGTAHQLLECGLVNHKRQPEKYAVLGTPSMDVHDALYYMVNVLDLQEAYRKARYLMEQESLLTVRKDFPHINWTVPIVVEAEAGLRLGSKVELKDDKFTVGGFLLSWYEKTKGQILDLKKQLAEVPE